MRIVVCLKQTFDPATIRVSSRGEIATQEGVRIINPPGLCALEEALTIKDGQGAEVIALTLGGLEAEDALREALAMGADQAILLSDPAFADSDNLAVSYALARGVETVGEVDLVLCGEGQAGPQLAETLGWPQITNALSLEVGGGRATGLQAFEDGARRVSVPLPALVTIPEQANIPRLAPAASIMTVYSNRTVETWSAADIGAESARLGAQGATVVVRRSSPAEAAAKGDIIEGSAAEAAKALAARLKKRGLI